VNLPDKNKPALVSWVEIMFIGFAFVFIAAASYQQSITIPVSPDIQPVNLSPDTTKKSLATRSA